MNKACPDCGTSIHMSAARCRCGWQEKGKQANGRDSFACTAYGCPLIGSSTRGMSNDRYCTMHAAHEEKEIQAITKGIRKRADAFKLIADIAALDQVSWWTAADPLPAIFEQLKESGYGILFPSERERAGPSYKWYSRCFGDLENAILADMGIHRAPRKPEPAPEELRRAFTYTPDQLLGLREAEADIAARERARKALEQMNSEPDF